MPSEDRELEEIMRRKLRELYSKAHERSVKPVEAKPVEVKDSTFREFVKKHPYVIIDFWAAWCYPCRMMAPTIDEMARKYGGDVAFGKLNVDENPDTAVRFNVLSIPTLIFFRNGREVDRLVGAVPKGIFESKIRKLIQG